MRKYNHLAYPNDFNATGRLIRLNLRQHRTFLVVWLFLPALLVLVTALTSIAMFPTQESLLDVSSTLDDPIVIGMHGKVLDLSIAGYTAWRTKVMCSLLAAIFSFIMVIRHTRREEEDGRRELISSTSVGRVAPLTAALISAVGINIVMSTFILLVMISAGFGFTGSFAHAFSIGACGCFFAAAAGVFAQIFTSARSATNSSIILLAVLMVSHIGWNMSGKMGGLMYFSPLEWPLLVRSYAGENYFVFMIAIFIIAIIMLISFKISVIRDVGQGIFPTRPGTRSARPSFRTALALSLRLQKGMLLSWVIFFGIIGFLLGSTAPVMANITSTAPGFTEFVIRLGGPYRAFMSLIIYTVSMVISIYSILSLQKMRSEESYMRVETVLALPVSRLQFYISHMLISLLGTAMILVIMGLTVGKAAAISTGDQAIFIRLFSETVIKIPAVWVIAGIAALLYGVAPRIMAGASYAMLGVFILLEFLWEQQAVSEAIFAISPFSHVYPTKEITLIPLLGLFIVALLFGVIGFSLFKRRDISSN